MRGLDDGFMTDLTDGLLSSLREAVVRDRDLTLEIRDNYFNIYYKGHNLLKLGKRESGYSISLHHKVAPEAISDLKCIVRPSDTERFVRNMPAIKEKILALPSGDREIEFEQMLIRANNCEPALNTDYFIIDRQIVRPGWKERFDLIGILWPIEKHKPHLTVPLALFEVKFSLNKDIQTLAKQLEGYYRKLRDNLDEVVSEAEALLRQKIAVGLFNQSPGLTKALGTLTISRCINDVRFVVILADYNPRSKLWELAEPALRGLLFADQIDLFHVGFGLWHANECFRLACDR